METKRYNLLKELVHLEEEEENIEIERDFLELSPSERQSRGKALLNLTLKEKTFSPAEHPLAVFYPKDLSELPLFSLEEGDLVTLYLEKPGQIARRTGLDPNKLPFPTGTIYEKTKTYLSVAFRQPLPEWLDDQVPCQLHKSVNRSTYRRMLEALDAVIQTRGTRLAFFRDILSGQVKATRKDRLDRPIVWQDDRLNSSQKKAVEQSLLANDVFLLHGPPGTGKTRVLVEMIRQHALQKKSIYVCAPSNMACDNILERLVHEGVGAIRLGHPARILESLREHTLDFQLAGHDGARELTELKSQLVRLFGRQERYRDRHSPGREHERTVREEISEIKDQIKRLKNEIFDQVIERAEVFVGTPSSIEDRVLPEKLFDLVVMDEATQATEPISWIPMARAKKVIMAGDHFQLPPTVRSPEAEKRGLGVSLFERYYDFLAEDLKVLLERQYRMNQTIMGFSSREFYKNKLVADESVQHQTLANRYTQSGWADLKRAFVYVDTAGKGFEEQLEPGSESRFNPEEAGIVLKILESHLSAGVEAKDIAIVCPYSAQVRYLTYRTPHPDVEIDSVDGFQGREKELVILSLVRSNTDGEMGFLADTRRMNVAMTRARRKLIVVGDSATISAMAFYRDFIQYAEENQAYQSAWEMDF